MPICGRTSNTLLLAVTVSRAVPMISVPVAATLPPAAAYTFLPADIAPDETHLCEPPWFQSLTVTSLLIATPSRTVPTP